MKTRSSRKAFAQPVFAYVGGRTPKGQPPRMQAINVYRVDAGTGRWTPVQTVGNLANPSFFGFDRSRRVLYTVHGYLAEVSAFSIDSRTGQLTFLNQQPTQGKNPAALMVDAGNRFLVVANYSSATIVSLPINADGSLGPVCDVAELQGEPGPHRIQQASSHPHHVVVDPGGRFVLVPDKGFDKIHVYRLARIGKLIANDPPGVGSRSGAAPRHMDFHPTKRCAYVINERDSTLTTYRFDASRGALTPLQIMPTLPSTYTGNNTAAEIAAAASGKFVYASNRGHDSIAIFSVNARDGTLKSVAWQSTAGKGPRFFAIEPFGNFLYAANEDSGTIVTFRINKTSGKLKETGQVIKADSPVCIAFTTLQH